MERREIPLKWLDSSRLSEEEGLTILTMVKDYPEFRDVLEITDLSAEEVFEIMAADVGSGFELIEDITVEAEVETSYYRGFPGSLYEPPEPEGYEIESIKVAGLYVDLNEIGTEGMQEQLMEEIDAA